MTTGTEPQVLAPAPALTVGEVLTVTPCVICGADTRCAHEVARLRRRVVEAYELNGRRP